ncbi:MULTISPECIES: ATP-binding protein [Nocardia]|uniref:LuxR family transcriptional regulator n=1 Tax=Nocardia sputorum TaxID=2984338 RepID=A0ABM8D154_9NOCA|nr:LuxR C-terminal-related transcriptional regulator [Nocardia sputorum]BDT92491.1 LuxR family transcriptional regulator [Nocardia sputorum]BDU01061.1 LuxR family transcriptional regulator [Nocardia sputorum]
MARRKPARVIGNVPFPITSFVGRQRELRKVRELLATARLVTLTGVGGVGKTRLATEVAAASRQSFADGVWLVDLADVGDAELLARAVMNSLGIVDLSNRGAEEQLIDHLADLHALLMLDNCEHLVETAGALCERLLRSCAGLRILTTSREALGVVGEHVYPVLPLSMPTSDTTITPTALTAFEAPTLLLERARAVRPELTVTERDMDAVTRVCHRLDGIPLAIELAAARLRSLTMKGLLERLDDRFTLLTTDTQAAAPRQRTLRALIDWSYGLCRPAERMLWARLSVFAGGFTLAAAEGVCAGPDLPREQILDLIDHLVAQSIVVLAPTDGLPRYRMLETIREYGWHRLRELGETEALHKRHCDYYLALAERCAEAWNGPGQAAGVAELRAEHGNLQAALDWATNEPAAAREALALVTALRYHWCADGFLGDGRRWVERALRCADQNSPGRIPALWVAAWVMLLQGDRDQADRALDECVARAAAVGDRRAIAWANTLRGTSELFRGRLAESIAIFERVLADFPDDDDVARLTLFQLAMAQAHSRDDRAPETARQAIALADMCGEQWSKSLALWALGFDQYVHGQYGKAVATTCAALEIQTGFNDRVATSLMIELMAWIAAARGEYRRAARLLGAVGSEWRRIGTSITAFGPHMGTPHDTCVRTTGAALPGAVLRAERARGEALDHDQAITYTLARHECAAEPAERDDTVLTAREQQVAELVAQGLSNRQIAERLVVSPRTVDRHLENILAKLGFSSRAQVAAWTAQSQRAR